MINDNYSDKYRDMYLDLLDRSSRRSLITIIVLSIALACNIFSFYMDLKYSMYDLNRDGVVDEQDMKEVGNKIIRDREDEGLKSLDIKVVYIYNEEFTVNQNHNVTFDTDDDGNVTVHVDGE